MRKIARFALALNGIVGFETSLGLGLQYLVKSGVLTLNELIEKMAVNPSRILRINKGSLSIDADADITIFDPSKEWTVDISKIPVKEQKTLRLTAFTLCGKPEYVIVGGKIVVSNGELA